ncbi:molybdopterin-dependent oxidoreductase [Aestuariivirga litoralis]|nr:molybdopterin-dependent oxidoreductase [Aestuariivirga litoralis]
MLLKRKEPKLLLPRTTEVISLERRLFMGKALSLGALTMLTGCNVADDGQAQKILDVMSKWNDKAQAALFNPNRMALTYSEAEITEPFPFNAYYSEDQAPEVKEEGYKLELSGLIDKKDPWTLDKLRALPQESQITRHICVEGWSAIGKWGGVPLGNFLRMVGADLTAKYVGFKCADDYYQSIDMASALHPQTIIALTWRDQVLPRKYGFPMKVRIPTKLGYKNPKYITAMYVTNDYPGGYWEDQGYNWYGGS